MIAHKDPKLPPPPALPDGPEWVRWLGALDPHQAESLIAAIRTLYPHDRLPDRVYRRVVAAFDASASRTPALAQSIAEFVALLDKGAPLLFRELAESYRVAALKGIEAMPQFRLVQRTAVRFLYDDAEVWELCGYEGASTHLGGYLTRGFNDLDWLPEPPPNS